MTELPNAVPVDTDLNARRMPTPGAASNDGTLETIDALGTLPDRDILALLLRCVVHGLMRAHVMWHSPQRTQRNLSYIAKMHGTSTTLHNRGRRQRR